MVTIARNHKTPHRVNGALVEGGSNLPAVETTITPLYHIMQEEECYLEVEKRCGMRYVYDFNKHCKVREDEQYPEDHIDIANSNPSEPVYKARGSTHLKMTVACTHLGLYAMRKRNTRSIQVRRPLNFAHHVWELKFVGALNPEDNDEFAFEDAFELLRQYFWGAPKLRYLYVKAFDHIQEAGAQNKVMILFYCPHACESFYKALSCSCFNVIMLSSDQSPEVRYKEVYEKFNDPSHPSQFILIPMTLKLLGFAMQTACHKVWIVEQPFNKATEDNAAMRPRRHGQQHKLEIDRLMMLRTWMLAKERKLHEK